MRLRLQHIVIAYYSNVPVPPKFILFYHLFVLAMSHSVFDPPVEIWFVVVNDTIMFVNEDTCAGVKLGGGMISHIQSELEISCLPKDIPENITVDVAELELGHSVHLSEVKLPANVELATPVDEEHDSPVVSCYEPKAEKIEEVEAAPVDDEAGDTDDNTKADADADSKEEDSK